MLLVFYLKGGAHLFVKVSGRVVIRPVSGERKDSTDVKTLTGRHQDTGSTPVFSSAHKLSPRTVRVNAVRYHSNFCELDRQAEYRATGEAGSTWELSAWGQPLSRAHLFYGGYL